MDRPATIIVPLTEAAQLVKYAFREYVNRLLNAGSSRVLMMQDALNYNTNAYLDQVLTEVFHDGGIPEVIGGTSASTRILIDAGLERDYAVPLALQVFRIVLNQLITFFPDLVLGQNCGYQYEMWGDYDAFITPPHP